MARVIGVDQLPRTDNHIRIGPLRWPEMRVDRVRVAIALVVDDVQDAGVSSWVRPYNRVFATAGHPEQREDQNGRAGPCPRHHLYPRSCHAARLPEGATGSPNTTPDQHDHDRRPMSRRTAGIPEGPNVQNSEPPARPGLPAD